MQSELEFRLMGLLEKYRALRRLRERREEAEAAGIVDLPEGEQITRRREFKEISARFPGALREMEVLSARALGSKADVVEKELEEIRRHPGRRDPSRHWIAVVLDYHAVLGEALAAKKWLSDKVGRGGEITPRVVKAFKAWSKTAPAFSRGVVRGASYLRRIHHPPAGRLHAVVFEELEGLHGLERKSLEQAVFGVPQELEEAGPAAEDGKPQGRAG